MEHALLGMLSRLVRGSLKTPLKPSMWVHPIFKDLHWSDKDTNKRKAPEHWRAASLTSNRNVQNPWGAHYSTEHSNKTVPTVPFSAEIVHRAQDQVDWELGETIKTAKKAPPLNTDSGWQLLPQSSKRLLPWPTHVQNWNCFSILI